MSVSANKRSAQISGGGFSSVTYLIQSRLRRRGVSCVDDAAQLCELAPAASLVFPSLEDPFVIWLGTA